MNDLYQHNITLIRHRWPEVAKRIEQADISEMSFEVVEDKAASLIIDGIQLSSTIDPIEEAFLFRQLVEGNHYIIWGLALGHLPELLTQDESAQTIGIVLFNFEVTKLVLHLVPFHWLNDPRIQLIAIYESAPNLNQMLGNIAFQNSVIITSERILAQKDKPWLSRRMDDRLYTIHCRLSHHERDSEYQEIENQNIKLLRKLRPIEEYLVKPIKTAIIVGAGPSLEHHIEELKWVYQQQERPEIIAAATACTCLKQHNIKPDAVFAIDIDIPESYINFDLAKDTPLLFASRMRPEIFTKWKGPKYFFHLSDPTYDRFAEAIPSFRLYVYGSVIHPTIYSALARGANKILLLGCDFGFPNEIIHSGLSNDTDPDRKMDMWIENGLGDEIRTESSYRMFLTGVESLIQQNPEIDFVNWSKIGAKIIGTRYLDYGNIEHEIRP